jgi:eukaryotic-like serine/threonine-protein kinase
VNEDRWHRLWSVFHSVRETPAGERDQALLRLCGSDEQLRGEILALLGADAEEQSALDSPVRMGGDGAAGIPGVGETIGNYRLVSVMGRGGMGIVYEGLQEQPIRRRVAIKLLRDELSNPVDQARFEAERQALALLSHSHIARVFEGGTAAGHPYFVMELVEGAPLTAWCDAQKLDIRARIELFIQVCEAVQHAHQRGIIHRDLKPSNIIVTTEDGRPIPKVIDFGIAKGMGVRLSSESIQTRAGTLLGTPEYMSPEQAGQAEVDTRSDVYALGTMLYELLCGAIPFEFGEMSLLAALDHIVRSEPPSPVARFQSAAPLQQAAIAGARSTSPDDLARAIRGDLEWIAMKAIEKEPDGRYASAGELANDLRHYLTDRPVMAGPPSGAYRLKKAIRRHRGAAAAIAAVAAALILGLVGTTWMAAVASRERDAAQTARDQARREAAVAKKTTEFVEGMLSAPDPMATAAAVRETKVVDVLERAEKELAKMTDEPEVAAAFSHTLAKTYFGLGMYPAAQPLLERTVSDRLRLLGPEHPDTLAAQHDLAAVYLRKGEFAKSLPLIRRTYLARERVLGRDDPETIGSLDQYATDLLRAGENEKAEPLLREALARSRRALGSDARPTLAISNNLVHLLRNRGKAEEAEVLQRDVVARRKRLLGDGHPDTINAANTLAMLLYDRGQTEEAFTLYRASVETYRRLLGDDHSRTLSARNNLAVVLWKAKRYPEAEAQLREILASHARGVGLEGPMALVARNNLARLVLEGGRQQEALRMYRELMPVAEKRMGAKDPNLATFRQGYAITLAANGHRGEAERYITLAHQQLLDSFGPDDKRTKQAAARVAELKATGKIRSQ